MVEWLNGWMVVAFVSLSEDEGSSIVRWLNG